MTFQATVSKPNTVLANPGCQPEPICPEPYYPRGWPYCDCTLDPPPTPTASTPTPPTPTPTPTPIPLTWKGVGHASGDDADIAKIEGELQSDWWYNWSMSNNYLSNPKYVAMVWCYVPNPTTLLTKSAVEPRDRTWLIFNEPDSDSQCNISASVAASRYDNYYDKIKQGSNGEAKILVGGTAYLPTTTRGANWWNDFLNEIQRPIEGIHIHAYPGQGSDGPFTSPHCNPYYPSGSPAEAVACLTPQLDATYNFFQSKSKTAGKPIWITETAILGRGHIAQTDMRNNFMSPLLTWFKNSKDGQYPLWQGLGWFSDNSDGPGPNSYPDSNLLNSNGSLTTLGLEWKDW